MTGRTIVFFACLLAAGGCHKKSPRAVEPAGPQRGATTSPQPWPAPRSQPAAASRPRREQAAASPAPSAAGPAVAWRAATEPASKPSKADPHESWPRTYEQAVAAVIAGLGADERDLFASLPKDKALLMRRDWPRRLERQFGLPENRALLDACAARVGPATQAASQPWQLTIHPDRAAELILQGAWDALQRKP